jgi:hypothetical protein
MELFILIYTVQAMLEADIDCDHMLPVVKICTKLKKILKFKRGKARWDLERLHAQRQKVQDTQGKKSVQSNVTVGMWKCSGTMSRSVC